VGALAAPALQLDAAGDEAREQVAAEAAAIVVGERLAGGGGQGRETPKKLKLHFNFVPQPSRPAPSMSSARKI